MAEGDPVGRTGCTCTTCSTCGGMGTIKIASINDYELELCDNCEHGITEECDYCLEQRERDHD